ncbi:MULTISPECIES: sodium:proton antiporter [unclassified Arcicella]|uniref:sodium:proton antiporter n=1 Tax=unclassified Arcicella TaxID=2644986 RepID=UPI0028676126|nr:MULTISPECIES: sodium:proton antiporter [unclassified Arcicella]MDR6560869.1 Kef-type K+ transport system membrane component KefB [Arcicella sp. BE51]MDR6810753.1 Kef-type K+ transport system membrane component KefB [Arcicella sp. BE140]MDR6822103.1 Kef-type K+ transport system membrane component KefB [Arcicella sp. BE139]
MSTTIIITVCSLLLIAYAFDLTASRTKIPSVILLLLLGWLVKQVTTFTNVRVPNLTAILPVLGTIGLILIVLEGALELELDKSKIPIIKKSFIVGFFPMVILAFLMAATFQYFGGGSFKNNLTNVIPLCVVSSAIAIPSVKNLKATDKEFIIYESSLSDIIGVLFFNFMALNATINVASFTEFAFELLIIIIVSFVSTATLSFLLSKIEHPIKFGPIILLVILIYAIAKLYHLPSLVFILLLGLFLGNLDKLKQFHWIQRLKPDQLEVEVNKFHELVGEATFLIRALFFLLFGYLIESAEILNTDTLSWALGIVFMIFLIRAIQLKLSKLNLRPLLFVAPRGLITILLFLAIEPNQHIPLMNKSLIIQVIVLTALVMMFGLMNTSRNEQKH